VIGDDIRARRTMNSVPLRMRTLINLYLVYERSDMFSNIYNVCYFLLRRLENQILSNPTTSCRTFSRNAATKYPPSCTNSVGSFKERIALPIA
jgi:hypothetical protein